VITVEFPNPIYHYEAEAFANHMNSFEDDLIESYMYAIYYMRGIKFES